MNTKTTKTTVRYHKPGALRAMELQMDAMSAAGWQIARPGRFLQRWQAGEGCFVHRLGRCEGRADTVACKAAQERAGWELVLQQRDLLLFRKPADTAEPEEALEGGREPFERLFRRRIERMESVRRWMLVLASVLLIAGYLSGLLPVLYGCVLPLAVALFVTYRIKFYEEGLRQ